MKITFSFNHFTLDLSCETTKHVDLIYLWIFHIIDMTNISLSRSSGRWLKLFKSRFFLLHSKLLMSDFKEFCVPVVFETVNEAINSQPSFPG
uniref:Uncharacterized protein n=1 Tax=Arundo donax TaxID=35708 RepID=A0A0A9CX93_ARUDO